MTAPEPTDVPIREATAEDVDELARLRWQMTDEVGGARQSLDEFRSSFAEAYRRFDASDTWTVLVAESPSVGRLAGCLWVKRIERVPRPNDQPTTMGYVTNVYVEPPMRNRGLGTRLLGAARAVAERDGLTELFVWPSEAAASLYRRAGYVPSGDVHELELIPDL